MDCTFGRASLKTKGRKTEGMQAIHNGEKEQLSMEVVILSNR